MKDDIMIIQQYLYVTDDTETRIALMKLMSVLKAWNKNTYARKPGKED